MRILILLLCLSNIIALSQSNNRTIKKPIFANNIILTIDSFSIVPNSLSLFDEDSNYIDSSKYLVNEIDSKIKIIDSLLLNQKLIIEYKRYPVLLSKNYYRRKLDFIDPDNENYWKYNKKEKLLNINKIIKEGEITRTAMIGNNQNLSLLSNLDLRISGKLDSRYRIEAVISDNNIPFQEDGETYKLQEFDKVYMRIYDSINTIIAGDLEINHAGKYLKFQKKTQGLIFLAKHQFNELEFITKNSFNFSKGKYATNSFLGIEGNQGPYKMTGNNNEPYIIILSGSEKVFIDGKRLKRGEQNDYIINYNTAEIIFTNKMMITKDKRIFIEFEYDNKSYSQSIISSLQEVKYKNLNLSFKFYSEMDWKNQDYINPLNDQSKSILAESGDNISNITTNSIDSVEFSQEKILYKKLDTIIGNNEITYYKFSVSPDSAFYEIKFTLLNENEGHYILDQDGINGRIYKWIPPLIIDGQVSPQGNYSPQMKIISPKAKTIISTAMQYKVSTKLNIKTNIALQYHDKNLFSNLDDNDNNSIASTFLSEYNLIDNSNWKLRMINEIEYISNGFEGVNRFQDVEFNRDWNITSLSNSHLLIGNSLVLFSEKKDLIEIKSKFLKKDDNYIGQQNILNIQLDFNKIKLSSLTHCSNIHQNDINSEIFRSENSIINNFKKFVLTFNSHNESILNYTNSNNLNLNSFSFIDLSSNLHSKSQTFSINFRYRKDKKSSNNMMSDFSLANEMAIDLYMIQSKNLKYKNRFIYRKLKYFSDSLLNENNLINSNMLNMKLFKNLISININYDLSKGKESKQEKSFIKVPLGLGTHIWVDNNNNNIEELNEFMIAVFKDEAEYIPLYLPSNELENIYLINYIQNVNINFKEIFKKNYLNKLHFSSLWNLNNKTTEDQLIYNPFIDQNIDSSITYISKNLHAISYNKSDPRFNFQILNRLLMTQNSFSYGKDNSQINEYEINSNLKFFKLMNSSINIKIGEKKNTSSFFETKNFRYSYTEYQKKLSFEKLNKSTSLICYTYKSKKSESTNNSILKINEISFLYNIDINERLSVDSEIKLVDINFLETENAILNYELMEGLSNGKNILFSINYKQKLKNNLMINLGYNLRKSENNEVKHIGNISVQAYF